MQCTLCTLGVRSAHLGGKQAEESTPRLSLGVLAFLLMQLQLKYASSKFKYTSVYLNLDSAYLRGVGGGHLVQLQRNVDEEGGKYTEAMAEVYLPPSESTLLRSPPSPHPPTVGLMISTPTAKKT